MLPRLFVLLHGTRLASSGLPLNDALLRSLAIGRNAPAQTLPMHRFV